MCLKPTVQKVFSYSYQMKHPTRAFKISLDLVIIFETMKFGVILICHWLLSYHIKSSRMELISSNFFGLCSSNKGRSDSKVQEQSLVDNVAKKCDYHALSACLDARRYRSYHFEIIILNEMYSCMKKRPLFQWKELL